jgi:hypothetical protein
MSSIKYFKFRPYFIGVLWKSCGYPRTQIVDKSVEITASFLLPKVTKNPASKWALFVHPASGGKSREKKF